MYRFVEIKSKIGTATQHYKRKRHFSTENWDYYYYYYYYYWYSALGPVWAETRVQSGDWYGSGTLHPGQVVRGNLPLLSPEIGIKENK